MPEYIVPKALKRVVGTVTSHAAGPSAAKQPRQSAAKAAFERQSNDPLMVSQVDFGKRRPAQRRKKDKAF